MSKPNILLIEDNKDLCNLLKIGLCKVCELESVSTLAEGVARAKSNPPTLILLDLNLPDSSGEATINAVQEACPRIPFIVISGSGDSRTAILSGAQDYIDKTAKLSFRSYWSKIANSIVRHKVRPTYQPLLDALKTSVEILDELRGLAAEPDSWTRDRS